MNYDPRHVDNTELLACSHVRAEGATPSRLVLFCHGVFGTGTNLRTVAQQAVRAAPSWGAVLVDLRGHGGSVGLAPPHSLEVAASDLDRLARSLPLPVAAVVGHSFGGKVATLYATERSDPLSLLVVLDSSPSASPHALPNRAVITILEALEQIPSPIPSRAAWQAALVAAGQPKPIVDWLGMNLKLENAQYHLRLNLPAIRTMLAGYFASDTWSHLVAPGTARHVDLVIGGASNAFSSDDIERARTLSRECAQLGVHLLDGASHWVHVDKPVEVASIIAHGLNRA